MVSEVRARRLTAWAAGLIGATALLVLAGWLFRVSILVRLVPSLPPVRFNLALGLLGAAVGLWGIARNRRSLLMAGGTVAFVIGVASLVEYALGTGIAVDRLIVGDIAWATIGAPFPPRMPAAAALKVTLIGVAFFAVYLDQWNRLAASVAGTMGTIIAGVSAVALLSQATGVLSDTIRVSGDIASGIQGTVAFVLIGLTITFHSWRQADLAAVLPDWLPHAAATSMVVATMFFWRAILAEEHRLATEQLSAEAGGVARQLSIRFEATTRALRRLGSLSIDRPEDPTAPWMVASAQLIGGVDGLTAVAWLDSTMTIGAIQPQSAATDPTMARLGQLLEPLLPPRRPIAPNQVVGLLVDRPTGPPYYLLAVPRCGPGGCHGRLVAKFDAQPLVEGAVAGTIDGYAVVISNRQAVVYQSPDPPPELRGWTHQADFAAAGSTWTIAIWPRPATLLALRTDLPAVVAGLGIAVSLLLAATLGLVRSSVGSARQAERDRLARAVETTKDGLWEKDLLTGTGNRSEAMWQRLGYAVGQVPPGGQEALWTSLVHPDDRGRVNAALTGHLDGDADAFEAQYRIGALDGGWHRIVDRGRVVARGPDGRPVRMLGICADITEQERADEALATSEQRFRTLFENRLQFESLLDADGAVLEANRTALSYLQGAEPDVRGRKLWDTPWWSGAERVERLKAAFDKASHGETVRYEEQIRVGPDRLATMAVSLTPILNSRGAAIQYVVEGQPVPDGDESEGAMRELTTLSMMGRFAGKVAHEINNPLAGIQNAFLLIKDAVPESHPYFRFVGAIEREIDRIAAVTRQLYETYRSDDENQGSAVATVIADVAAVLGRVTPISGVTIDIDTTASPSVVPIPSGLLRQAVYNLVQNAIEASPQGGMVSVRAWTQGDTFWLTVRDRGPGVPEEIQGRIFDAFVSTKLGPTIGGMGLGLSLVRRSVEATGGSVTVQNAAEGGALFTIQIPCGPRPGDSP